MAVDPLTAALTIGGQVIDRIWPDPADQAKAQLALLELAQRGELAQLTAQADAIKTEAVSEHWLSAVWRPLLMLTFGGLIVARWFG